LNKTTRKTVEFTPHAEEKITRLLKVGITKDKVIQTVLNPVKVFSGYFGRKIAQSDLSSELVLRVVYEERNNKVVVISMYPGERRRYK